MTSDRPRWIDALVPVMTAYPNTPTSGSKRLLIGAWRGTSSLYLLPDFGTESNLVCTRSTLWLESLKEGA